MQAGASIQDTSRTEKETHRSMRQECPYSNHSQANLQIDCRIVCTSLTWAPDTRRKEEDALIETLIFFLSPSSCQPGLVNYLKKVENVGWCVETSGLFFSPLPGFGRCTSPRFPLTKAVSPAERKGENTRTKIPVWDSRRRKESIPHLQHLPELSRSKKQQANKITKKKKKKKKKKDRCYYLCPQKAKVEFLRRKKKHKHGWSCHESTDCSHGTRFDAVCEDQELQPCRGAHELFLAAP